MSDLELELEISDPEISDLEVSDPDPEASDVGIINILLCCRCQHIAIISPGNHFPGKIIPWKNRPLEKQIPENGRSHVSGSSARRT
ncbi:hypothetical protein AB4072_14405 [Microvirga sp. 2MCAF38]|uniref:hypothetical protein n=1 Tax=Microvirga sp. 2MCAF38 TaxID=3232989 RepID=UPI003F9B5BBF